MILIESIKTVTIERDDIHRVYEIAEMNECGMWDPSYEILPEEMHIKVDMVRGQRFRNCRGEEVVIGATKRVQDLIGMPLDYFNRMGGSDRYSLLKQYDEEKELHEKDNKDSKRKYVKLNNRLNKNLDDCIKRIHKLVFKNECFENMRFSYRLKFLFMGNKLFK